LFIDFLFYFIEQHIYSASYNANAFVT